MGQKTNNRILWHGNGLNAEGKAVAPVKAVAGGDGTDGLNEGELYICNSDSDPALFILTDAGNVVRIDGNGSDTYTREQINEKLNAKVDVAFFSRMFGLMDEEGGEIQVNDVETLASSIKAKLGFWTEQYLSAKGNNPDSGSEVSGATTLAALSDVSITGTPKDGQVLAFDATLNKWTPVDMEATAGIDEEELLQILTQKGYATQQWVTQQSYAKTSVRIKAGTGLTGGGTLAQDVTLSLATVGTAGTYTKVTVDAYGRVTGHSSLAAGDIPALAISKITGLQAALDAKLNKSVFEEMFEKVYVSGYGYAIRAKLAFYSDDWISAKGLNSDAGSTTGGVDKDEVLQIVENAGYIKSSALNGYATQTWASGQFALKTVAINAGTGLTGGGNLSANRTLSLATVGTAGTYTKVTVDAYGRVTGHSSLAAGDIPALAISKITGLQAALDAKMDAADFEELFEKVWVSGYGYAIRAKLALYTDSWMSAKGSNPDAGSVVTGGIDEEELAEYLTTHGYATQSWVNQQGFLKSSALSGYLTQTAADSLYVNVSGDTMTGRLTISTSDNQQLYLNGTSQSQIAFRVNGTTQSLVGYSYTSGAFLQIGSHWINMRSDGTAYVDNEYTIWHSGNDGSGSGLDADLLDGVHLSDIRNGNVYSATKLQTARTLWGQSFDGTANVSGDMTGVGNIIPSVDNSYYCGRWDRRWNFLYSMNYNIGSHGSNYLGDGNGDGASFSTYNVNLHLHYGLGITSNMDVCNIVIDGRTGNISTRGSVQIGSARLIYDSTNNALYVQKSDGSQCGFYATGFVSAKGANDDGGDTEATVLTIADERNTAIYPDTYAGRGIRGLFRANATDGLNDGGTYHTVLHIRQWTNSSGGLSHQLAFTDNGGVWHRTALSETAWGEWSELSALSGLSDVSLSSPSNGQSLVYRNGVWRNETVSGGGSSSVAWADVTGKPSWIGSTKPSYSFSEITGTPSVTISSSNATNLSINVEGARKTISNLYAEYLGGTTKAGLFTGMTYSGNRLSVTVGGTTRSVTINAGSSGSYLPLSGGTISGDLKVQGEATFNTQSVHNYGILTSNIYTNQSMYVRYNGSNTARIYCNWASGMTISVDGANTEFTNTYIATGTSTASAFDLGISNRRWRTIYSVNSLNTSSDLRLKTVLRDIPLTVEQVAAAPSFLYRWKKDKDGRAYAGSAAQYWQKALPQAVTEGADGYLAMEYDRIALAAAIATARAVETLDQRVARLEKENKKLRFRIKMLEKR